MIGQLIRPRIDGEDPLRAVTGHVKHGGLSDLVREVVTRPVRELWRYAITVDGAPEGATSDIFLLARRFVRAPGSR